MIVKYFAIEINNLLKHYYYSNKPNQRDIILIWKHYNDFDKFIYIEL